MPGNWPARFLGEGAATTSSPYPTLTRLSDGLYFSGIHGPLMLRCPQTAGRGRALATR